MSNHFDDSEYANLVPSRHVRSSGNDLIQRTLQACNELECANNRAKLLVTMPV